ncbi:MAG: SIMPL domain-containing protein [Ignavibacteria bacterium]|nr:SIMPL domain-containing protein [Ignavibacteria bacterium]
MKYIFLFILASVAIANAEIPIRYINVTGTSEIKLQADIIHITLAIKTIDISIEKSKKNNDKIVDICREIFQENKIDPKSISIKPMDFGKNFETNAKGESIQKGFYTESTIEISLKDFSRYYTLTSELSKNNSISISSSQYGNSEILQHQREATLSAVKIAKEKAEQMAQVAGMKLGDVLEIDESQPYTSYAPQSNSLTFGMEAQPEHKEISGELSVKKSVRVKFEIIPAGK